MAKGGSYEREICTTLSRWWAQDDDTDDLFWRTAGSGARATVRGRKRTRGHYGDICATHPSAEPFLDICTVEIKRGYNRSTIAELFDLSPNSAIKLWEKWLVKAQRDADSAGSFAWIIISRRNRCEALVTMPSKLCRELISAFDDPLFEARVRARDKKEGMSEYFEVCGVTLSAFLRVPPKTFIELAKRL